MSDAYQPIEADSHEDRVAHPGRKGGTSTPGAIWSVVCTTVGAGVCSLPYALHYCGWMGLFLIVFVSIISNSTAKLLAKCMHLVPGKRLKSYEEIGYECFGNNGKIAVAIFQSVTLFGVCCIFLILIGINMNALVPHLTMHSWALIFVTPLIPVAWLKTMKEVSFIAFFGLIASLVVSFVVIVNGFHTGQQENGQVHDFANWGGLSNAFNVVCFSFGVHAVIPAIEHEMARPQDFHIVSNSAFSIICSIYLMVSAAGYYGYGNAIAGNVLQSMPEGNAAVKAANIFITAHVFLAYPLPLNPLCRNLEAALGTDKLEGARELTTRITVRTILVLSTAFVATVVPYFGQFLSLISALSVIATAFVFPPIFYYVLHMRQFILHVQDGYYQVDEVTEEGGVDTQSQNARESRSVQSPRRVNTMYAGDVSKPIAPHNIMYLCILLQVGVIGSVVGCYFSGNDLATAIRTGGNPFDHFWVTPGQ